MLRFARNLLYKIVSYKCYQYRSTMKSTFYILGLILVVLSCNSDDDVQQNTEPTLFGPWSLVNVSGGFAGVNDDFEIGTITWNFNL